VQRGHAIANSVRVAAVNRVGDEGDIRFFGSSFVTDAFGNVLSWAGKTGEEVFPDREVVGIDCTAMVPGFGAIHCISQQQPSVQGAAPRPE
jgi:hypothetical protein